MNKLMRLRFALALASLVVPAFAQEHTNFSGRWRMDRDRSDFGKFRKPDLVTRTIEQRDPNMNVHLVQTSAGKTSSVDVTYTTDGSSTNNVINGRDAACRTYWDGPVLVVHTDMKTVSNDDEQIEDRYDLSGDTLTITSHVITSRGDARMTLVSTREK